MKHIVLKSVKYINNNKAEKLFQLKLCAMCVFVDNIDCVFVYWIISQRKKADKKLYVYSKQEAN